MGAKTETATIREVSGIKLILRDFGEEVDVNRMVQTANEITKKDDFAVTIFYGADEKTARIIVMAGQKAVEKGVDANEIAKEASKIIGGGGGGRRNFAQGGGPLREKLQEAVKKAEEVLENQLKRE
jgi:alanyl-tRNA synthetase